MTLVATKQFKVVELFYVLKMDFNFGDIIFVIQIYTEMSTRYLIHFSDDPSCLYKILLFNVIKGRRGDKLLAILDRLDFDLVIFSTTLARRAQETDNTNFTTSLEGRYQQIVKGYVMKLFDSVA